VTHERDAVVVAGIRTPFAAAWTALAGLDAVELGRIVVRELVERSEIDPADVDELIVGNVSGSRDATNLARVIALEAKLSDSTPAFTVDREGASGLQAVVDAAYRIRAGDADLVAVAGVESSSRVPMLFSDEARDVWTRANRADGLLSRSGEYVRLRPRHFRPERGVGVDSADTVTGLEESRAAELLAREFDLGREIQDEFAGHSHRKAADAWAAGRLEGEVVPVPIPPAYSEALNRDNGVRDGQALAGLSGLKPIGDSGRGTVTPGNSAQVADGAVALLLASRHRAGDLGLPVIGRVLSWGFAGCDPAHTGLGPVLATPIALRRAGRLPLEKIDRVEVHEAFAAQVLACVEGLRSRRFCEEVLGTGPVGEVDPGRLNVNGGAIALGHPMGASGARLVLTLLREMERNDLSLGLATLSVGGAQGAAVVVERS
jgi:acetyl-CoA C-acetyltransferase/acetyl-CoA acyltransferase